MNSEKSKNNLTIFYEPAPEARPEYCKKVGMSSAFKMLQPDNKKKSTREMHSSISPLSGLFHETLKRNNSDKS